MIEIKLTDLRLPQAIASKILVMPSGCWEWSGYRTRRNYGMAWNAQVKKNQRVHRIVWEWSNQARVPDGLELDHLCRNRGCVRLQHLQPVTHRVNMLRATVLQTSCKRGHPLSIKYNGKRFCRTCNNAQQAQRAHKRDGDRDW